MTDIEQKALALLKKCVGNAIWKHPITRINRQTNLEHEALCRAIEQHEAQAAEIERLKVQLSVLNLTNLKCPLAQAF